MRLPRPSLLTLALSCVLAVQVLGAGPVPAAGNPAPSFAQLITQHLPVPANTAIHPWVIKKELSTPHYPVREFLAFSTARSGPVKLTVTPKRAALPPGFTQPMEQVSILHELRNMRNLEQIISHSFHHKVTIIETVDPTGETLQACLSVSPPSASDAKRIFYHLANAVLAMHHRGIQHGSISLKNIRIPGSALPATGIIANVWSFAARLIHSNSIVYQEPVLVDFNHAVFSSVLSQRDVLTNRRPSIYLPASSGMSNLAKHNRAVDVYSLGIAMALMHLPQLAQSPNVRLGTLVQEMHTLHPQLQGLLHGMIKVDVANRLTMQQVVRHPWFTQDESLVPTHVFEQRSKFGRWTRALNRDARHARGRGLW